MRSRRAGLAKLEGVVAGLYTAFADDSDLTTELLSDEVRQTVPLSRAAAEKLDGWRTWAAGRAVAAA